MEYTGISEKSEDIAQELEKQGLDFLVLSERKKKDHGTELFGKYMHLYRVSLLILKKYVKVIPIL